jgi:hypothetical protein
MGKLEAALVELEERIGAAQRSAEALSRQLKRLKKAAQTGEVSEIERTLLTLAERAEQAAETATALSRAWRFDARSYLDDGYRDELRSAAATAEIELLEKDGRLYAFPLLLRPEPRELAVRVGKKLERRLRPSWLAGELADLRRRPQRFREQQFLDLLYRLYRRVTGTGSRRGEMGPIMRLSDIHGILTLLPNSDYSIEEFGRDLLLLDRKPDLRTRDGCRVSFPRSAIARERGIRPVKVYDEGGREHTYLGLSFVKDS